MTVAKTTSKAELTGKITSLIDAVQGAVPFGLTRGEVNTLVRAAFGLDPVHQIDRVLDDVNPLLIAEGGVHRIMRAAFNADQETLDALLWGEDVPAAVAP